MREGRDRVEGHTSLGHTGVDTHRCFALAASKPRSRRDRVHGSARRRAAPSAAGPAAHPRGQESALSVRAHPRWMAAAGEMAMHIATLESREEGRRRTDRGDGGGAARPGRRSRRRRLKASPRSGMNLTFRCPGQPRLGTPRGGSPWWFNYHGRRWPPSPLPRGLLRRCVRGTPASVAVRTQTYHVTRWRSCCSAMRRRSRRSDHQPELDVVGQVGIHLLSVRATRRRRQRSWWPRKRPC